MIAQISCRWEVLEMSSEDMEQRSSAGKNSKAGRNFRNDHTRSQAVSGYHYKCTLVAPWRAGRAPKGLSRHRGTSVSWTLARFIGLRLTSRNNRQFGVFHCR